ncbi:OVARIAN TUMOR DOMAIN-containing deubiquitinating enzyme 9 [Linum grandiflorum]
MMVHEQDPDVVRWGLHNLIDVCAIRSNGSCSGVTQYEADRGQVGYVSEFYNEPVYTNNIESDAVIARALQEELSHVAAAEASGRLDAGQDSIIAQDWRTPSGTYHEDGQRMGDDDNRNKTGIPHSMQNEPDGFSDNKKAEESDQVQVSASPSSGQQNYPSMEDVSCDIDIADEHEEYALDGEVGKRINQMVPIPHVPKINGDIPTLDEEVSDHQRLLDRLKVYFLVENKIQGDGNCQFRALSDQLYRSSDYHKFVRQQVVDQLRSHSDIYEGYVPMPYGDYLNNISKSGEWGDHVTLQAAADSYGVKIFVLTSFKDTCYIEIIPHVEKSKRIIFLSFWAEVHYNSIYPEGGESFLLLIKKRVVGYIRVTNYRE